MQNDTMQAGVRISGVIAAMLLTAAGTTVADMAAADTTQAADYIDLRRSKPIAGDAAAGEAKATTCIACHGDTGVSPASVFPHLRGQTAEYLYWSLVDFTRGTRPASPMTPLVANLSDQDLRDLAAFYARPATPATGQPGLVSSTGAGPLDAGERLYRSGDPGRGIPPCQGCHGIDGSGHPLADAPGAAGRYRTYPALQGQWADFLVMNLTAYRDGSLADSTNDFVMTGAARGLDDEAIQALAAWLSAITPVPQPQQPVATR